MNCIFVADIHDFAVALSQYVAVSRHWFIASSGDRKASWAAGVQSWAGVEQNHCHH